jgi:hypothetical protein
MIWPFLLISQLEMKDIFQISIYLEVCWIISYSYSLLTKAFLSINLFEYSIQNIIKLFHIMQNQIIQ